MRVVRPIENPADPQAIAEHASRLHRVVDGGIEFGSPQNPNDPQSSTRADGVSHNGILQNIDGSWFEAVLTSTGKSTVTCIHNLNSEIQTNLPATVPNVRWLNFAVMHDGTGADATSIYRVQVWYQGGSRDKDQISLGFDIVTAGTAPTINADHPVVVTLFFSKAVR